MHTLGGDYKWIDRSAAPHVDQSLQSSGGIERSGLEQREGERERGRLFSHNDSFLPDASTQRNEGAHQTGLLWPTNEKTKKDGGAIRI